MAPTTTKITKRYAIAIESQELITLISLNKGVGKAWGDGLAASRRWIEEGFDNRSFPHLVLLSLGAKTFFAAPMEVSKRFFDHRPQ